ncbi:MAG: hypothetical protein WB949_17110 [Candidatus Acidiferrales bacterium]
MQRKRQKISTTIGSEGYAFLRTLIKSGKAQNLAQAIDLVLEEFRRIENRQRLDRATAEYYETASQEAIDEGNQFAAAFSATASEIKIDG